MSAGDGADGPAPRSEHVRSLDRGLAVIRAFDAEHPEQSLSDVARRTGLTRAAARRFLLTLAELGYVRTDGKLFALTPRVLELGYAYLSSLSLPEVAAPHLEALVREVQESASVSVLDGADVVYVARVPTSRIMTVAITIGTRLPAFATSMGRVLLAALPPDERARLLSTAPARPLTERTITDPDALGRELDAVREAGYCVVDQELELGLRSISVPVRDRNGEVVAAANVSTRAGSRDVVRDVLPALRACAAAITADLAAGA
ncbi:IclR family transcriptional regulator domain-containing protein [Pseudonocardia kunmingensis]|uniref:Glycerol operon regulatory protein n=1 Tax=Pseudonocardia kunmingensis TaxID=630975 RepID=A0A543DXU4_9PSEU|nr:IclR family transcriptional regulator C-terminal domain-containing protein [Pseudonocardia kunmingensis]TQM14155.1 IclR family transcriptional regulator [Pseudonocardia kunmingensis]